jgi:hypothetical protein
LVDAIPGSNQLQRLAALLEDRGVLDVKKKPKPVDAAAMERDRSVAQIKPEQIDVVVPQLSEPVLGSAAS